MKYLVTFLAFTVYMTDANAQNANQLREQARTYLQEGNFDKTINLLTQARKAEPGNIEVMKDLSFANYLKRDFVAAIEVGKQMVERPDADAQAFQILGMSYKATASTKEAAKLFKTAIQKFPNSGVAYNEYGELFAFEKEFDEAIDQWEKGIQADPGYSSNYFNAAAYYNRTQNWLRAVLYAETFLNLESFSQRAEDAKAVLRDAYSKLLVPGVIAQLQGGRSVSAFEKQVLSGYAAALAGAKNTSGIEGLYLLRRQFLADWSKQGQQQYPYRLFEHQRQLVTDGAYEAYNYWLLSSGAQSDAYKIWQGTHASEDAAFKKWQGNKIFKIPAGQYYFKS